MAITPPTGAVATALVDVWLDAGVEAGDVAVLLRSPGLAPDATLARTAALAERSRAAGYPLWLSVDTMVPPTPDLVAHAGLSGVVVRGDPDAAALDAMQCSCPGLAVSRSAHGEPRPVAPPPHFSTYAPVFAPRTSQPGRDKVAVGIDALARFCAGVPEPVFALGGISAENAESVMAAGAWGLASIRAFFGPPRTVVHDVEALLSAARAADGLSTHQGS
jgi:thiamine-phosphate pyrophosphorylase